MTRIRQGRRDLVHSVGYELLGRDVSTENVGSPRISLCNQLSVRLKAQVKLREAVLTDNAGLGT